MNRTDFHRSLTWLNICEVANETCILAHHGITLPFYAVYNAISSV